MNTATAEALLAWLLTYTLHSTILLSVVALTLRTRRFAPAVADVAWKAALLGGLLTASAQGLVSRRPAGTLFIGGAAVTTPVNEASWDTEVPVVAGQTVLTGVPAGPDRTLGSAEHAIVDASTRTPASMPASSPSRTTGTASLLAFGWLIIAFALVGWYAACRLILVGRLGDRRAVVDGAVLSTLEELRRDARTRSAVRLTASATISSPVALGGEICLPAAAIAQLDSAQLRAMLAHELAHLERRDPQWLAFACVMERAFFFQPLNRLARRRLQENAEYCADEWAAQLSGGVPLAKALVKVAEWIQASPLGVPVAGFAEERSQLTVRVMRLLDGAVHAPRSRVGATALAAAVLLLTAAFAPGVSGGVTGGAASGSASEQPAVEDETDPVDAGRAEQESGEVTAVAALADTAIVRAVMARLRDEDAEVRRAAADALGRMRHPMSIDALVLGLDDLDGEVRRAALHALGNFERTRLPVPPIRRMLANEDAEMRSTALRILAEQRDRTSIPAITRLLADENDDVRYSALRALEELDAPVSDDLVVQALADRSTEVREAAASLAAERQVTGAVPQLIKLLEDRSGSVREHAAEALTEMRTPAAHEALRRALTHRDPSVRRIAVEYFGEEVDK